MYDHASSNPQCQCELCRMNSSIVAPNGLRPETGLTGIATQTAVTGYRSETDPRELALYQQIRIGQRVIARVKKSEFDLEPQNLTGIVKYVGTIDSEYVDNRLYVGVKLDEAGKLFSVSFFPSDYTCTQFSCNTPFLCKWFYCFLYSWKH